MNIAIISRYDWEHSGTALQSYALAEYLHSCGHQVRIIDYQPRYLRRYRDRQRTRRPKVLRWLHRLRLLPRQVLVRFSGSRRSIRRFRRIYLPMTPCYRSGKALRRQPPPAELYLTTGMVWNAWRKVGRDSAFYLTFAPKHTKKAAYAVSAASLAFPEQRQAQLRQWMKSLDAVGVREPSAVRMMHKLSISAQCVCDPIFLLHPMQWKPLCTEVRARCPYLLVCDYDNNEALWKLAVQLKKQRGYQIVSVVPHMQADVCCDRGPQDMLTHIRSAAFVLTNSYTALCLSVLYEREFVVFLRQEHTNSRLYDVLERLKLSDRLYSPDEKPWNQRTDYATARQQLYQWIRESKTYLKNLKED